jgi:hypothetical protein
MPSIALVDGSESGSLLAEMRTSAASRWPF